MKRAVIGFIILAGLGWAQPAKKVAMVLKVQGTVTKESLPVLTGQLWSPGDSIKLAAGSQVTVLMLNKGERQEISGDGSLEVAPEGLQLKGCKARPLNSTQLKLGLNGENHRQIGGMVLRGELPEIKNSILDRVEVGTEGLKISRPAAAGNPPTLKFYFLDRYYNPELNADLKNMRLPTLGVPPESIFAPQVAGRKQGQRWVYEVPWPIKDVPAPCALEAFEAAGATPQIYTRIYHSSPEERSELSKARKAVAAWAQKEPRTIEPAVYLANLLDEKGELEDALQALKPALALQPRDQGLVQLKARLLVDLGRYADAAQALKTVAK